MFDHLVKDEPIKDNDLLDKAQGAARSACVTSEPGGQGPDLCAGKRGKPVNKGGKAPKVGEISVFGKNRHFLPTVEGSWPLAVLRSERDFVPTPKLSMIRVWWANKASVCRV